jgi:ABC-type glycerol-3-phosphate transport system permease component
MNALQASLLALAAVFFVLLARSPRRPAVALRYARWVLLLLASAVVLAPFVWLLAAIFKDKSVLTQYVFFPPLRAWSRATMNFENFAELFRAKPSLQGPISFWVYLLNSTMYTTVSVVIQLFFSSLAGYALAKYQFRGKGALMLFMLGSMMIPSVLLLAPMYKIIVRIGLIDSLWGLIVPYMVSAYGIFLFRQACLSVPNEMIDAGRVDGCSELGIFYRLVLPLVRPIAAAFCLVSFLAHWNAFFAPNVFLQSEDKLTMPIILNLYLDQYQHNYGVFLAGTALAMIPPAILFLALQKEFIAGLTSGAVKG